MAYEPLRWMAGEAKRLGLLLKPVPFCASGDPLQAWRVLLPLIVFGGLVVLLSVYGSSLKQGIGDCMSGAWRDSRTAGGCTPMSAVGVGVYRLRMHPAYQGTFRFLKYTLVPNVYASSCCSR